MGHIVQYLMHSGPKPGTLKMRSQQQTVRTEVFVGQGIRWTRGGGLAQGHGGGGVEERRGRGSGTHKFVHQK